MGLRRWGVRGGWGKEPEFAKDRLRVPMVSPGILTAPSKYKIN